MRRFLICTLLLAVASLNVGCVMPIFSSQPETRARELIFTSENFRHIPDIWERIWALEMPDLATPYRTFGGII